MRPRRLDDSGDLTAGGGGEGGFDARLEAVVGHREQLGAAGEQGTHRRRLRLHFGKPGLGRLPQLLLDPRRLREPIGLRAILIGAQAASTPFVACCEDDTLYAPSHFTYRPALDTFAYDRSPGLTPNERAAVLSGRCPFRTNGTFEMSRRGIVAMDLSEATPTSAGQAMLDGIDAYAVLYKPARS